MKSPVELSARLTKQWQNGETREKRLLSSDVWPIQLAISLPSAQQFVEHPATIRDHITQWRNVKTGQVNWKEKKYIQSSAPIELPESWQINTPSDWVAATHNTNVQQEYKILEQIVTEVDAIFHSVIVRKRHLILSKPIEEVIQATQVALNLAPDCAQGKPLRALSVANSDSKFFERNRNLITQFLDIRFDNATSDTGLEQFLGAADESDHWLLVAPLDDRLLPFEQMRIRANELVKIELPASHIIIVENEQCLYQLPHLSNTIAILGAGLNLSWLKAPWLKIKTLAYWGDLDTWGLTILANARTEHPHLTTILMDHTTFDKHAENFSVTEPKKADSQPPSLLTGEEKKLYMKLYAADKGRLEQEFLPESEVNKAVSDWHTNTIKKTSETDASDE